jgi:hypothetical protein
LTRRDGLEGGFASEVSDDASVVPLVDPSSEMGSSRRIPFAGSFVVGLFVLTTTQELKKETVLLMHVPEIDRQP